MNKRNEDMFDYVISRPILIVLAWALLSASLMGAVYLVTLIVSVIAS